MEKSKNPQSDSTLNTQDTNKLINPLGTKNINIANQYATVEINYIKYILPYDKAVLLVSIMGEAKEILDTYYDEKPPKIRNPEPIKITFLPEEELSALIFLADMGIENSMLQEVIKVNKAAKYEIQKI